jgi:hypothetical protein
MAYTKDNSFRAIYRYSTKQGAGPLINTSNKFLIKRTRTGNLNPKWRKQVASHANAATDMSGTYESVDSLPINTYRVIKNVNLPDGRQTESVRGDLIAVAYLPSSDSHVTPTIDSSAALNRARAKAYQQIRKAQVAMSGGVFLGEWKEAVHMLRHPLKPLRDGLSGYLKNFAKKSKGLPKKKKLEVLSQTWLESSFGWRPFINDLEDAMSAYEEVTKNAGEQFRKIRAVGKDSLHISTSQNLLFQPVSNYTFKTYARTREEAVVVFRGEVRRRAVVTVVDKLRVFGLSPEEFVPTVWELLPWSFLVDYFTNIGDILEAGATDTSTVAWIEQATIRSRILEANMDENVDFMRSLLGPELLFLDSSYGELTYRVRSVSRVAAPVLNVPSFALEVPGSEMKELNMLALFTQANSVHPQNGSKLRGRTFR